MRRRRKLGATEFASYRPLSNPLTAVDFGSSAEIEIATFTMAVGAEHIENDSGAIVCLDYDTLYYVYYDDRDLSAKGHQFYMATTHKVTGIAGRFFVGSITTPPKGGSRTRGNDDGGWGQYRSLAQWDESRVVVKPLPEKQEIKSRAKGIRQPKNAKPRELKKLRKIRLVIDRGLKGVPYCQELDHEGVTPKRKWIEDGCPNTYTTAYKDPKWRKRIQQEKWHVGKMRGLPL
jgi:hypothetical protein